MSRASSKDIYSESRDQSPGGAIITESSDEENIGSSHNKAALSLSHEFRKLEKDNNLVKSCISKID
jgi:hypothetical protein